MVARGSIHQRSYMANEDYAADKYMAVDGQMRAACSIAMIAALMYSPSSKRSCRAIRSRAGMGITRCQDVYGHGMLSAFRKFYFNLF